MKHRGFFLILGAVLLVLLVRNYGFSHLTADSKQVGWDGLALLSLTFLPTLVGYSSAWLLCTPGTSIRHLVKFVLASTQSFAWNQLTPFIKIGGEFSKVTSLKRFLPEADAVTSVLVYNLSHTVGTLLSFSIGGFGIAFFIAPEFMAQNALLRAALLGLGILFALITLLVFFSPGLIQAIFHRLQRPEWATVFQSVHRWTLDHPRRFWSSVVIELCARMVEGVTFFVAFSLLKEPITTGTAVFLEISRSLMDTAIFFIPYNLGSREATLDWVLKSLFNDPKNSALSAVLLYRWVELSWTILGFICWSIIDGVSRVKRANLE